MTIREAAERLGKSDSALRRAIKAGKLHAAMVNGRYNITEESLNAYAKPGERLSAPEHDKAELERLRVENETLRQKLEEKDQLLEENRKRQDTIILQLTHQLEQSQRLLEHHKAPWWRRWSRKNRSSS